MLAFKERKPFPDCNREKSLLFGWIRSFTIFLALLLLLAVDWLQFSELDVDNVLRWSHNPLERIPILLSAVPKACDASGQDALHNAGVKLPFKHLGCLKMLTGLHLYQGDMTMTGLAWCEHQVYSIKLSTFSTWVPLILMRWKLLSCFVLKSTILVHCFVLLTFRSHLFSWHQFSMHLISSRSACSSLSEIRPCTTVSSAAEKQDMIFMLYSAVYDLNCTWLYFSLYSYISNVCPCVVRKCSHCQSATERFEKYS